MSGRVAININYDTLSEILGFPRGFSDPTREIVLDRFLDIAERRGIRYSVYVVGRDLEDAGFRGRVAELSRAGHEIGNHSWSHPMDLGVLEEGELADELRRSHEAICAAAGVPPKGFIAPAWCDSPALRSRLASLGYAYDTSSFPSWLLYPMIARLVAAYAGDPKASRLLRRADWANPIFGRRDPHPAPEAAGLTRFPVPTVAGFAVWHTMAMMLPFEAFLSVVRILAKSSGDFYYLCHPLDLLSEEDLPSGLGRLPGLPRLAMPLREKLRRFESVLDAFEEAGRRYETVSAIVSSRGGAV